MDPGAEEAVNVDDNNDAEAQCAIPDYDEETDPDYGALDEEEANDTGTIVTPEGWHE